MPAAYLTAVNALVDATRFGYAQNGRVDVFRFRRQHGCPNFSANK